MQRGENAHQTPQDSPGRAVGIETEQEKGNPQINNSEKTVT